jgi:glycosyltransferase involved in cell wall biosynthesis
MPTSRRQMVILTPGFPGDKSDSTCIPLLQDFVLSARRWFPDVGLTVIAFQYPFERREYLWHDVRVIALGGANRPGIRRVATWLRAWKHLRQVAREAELSGLLSLWIGECAMVGKWFSGARDLKHHIWVLGQDARTSNRYVQRVKPKGSELIAISDFIQEQLSENFGIRAEHVITNGIDPDLFPPLSTQRRTYDIVGAGSLIPLKNYTLFLDLVQQLSRRFPALRTAIAGAGPEESALLAQRERLGLTEQVEFLGKLSRPAVLELMNDARLFLHPSSYEGNSTVLIEALYAGCRVVSFQGLSRASVANLRVCEDSRQMLGALEELLSVPEAPPERVLFNSIETTVRALLRLYG